MGRGQVRNIETVKVGPTAVNEFEYEKNQGQLTEQLGHQPEQQQFGFEQPTRAEQVKQITAAAHAKVEERKRKAARKSGPKDAVAKKSAGASASEKKPKQAKRSKQSVAKKSAATKSTVKKSTAKKSAAKTSTGKKSIAKKSPGRKSTSRDSTATKSSRKR